MVLANLKKSKIVWARDRLDPLVAKLKLLLQPLGAKTIILFGSAAKNNFTDESDLDVLIVVETKAEVGTVLRAANRLRANLPCALDVVCMSQTRFEELREQGGVAREAYLNGLYLIN